MRRAWIGCCCLVALGAASAFAAEGAGSSDVGPSLEYRPPRPILPEPKGPTPAPPVTVFRESFGGGGIGMGSFIRPLDVALGGERARYVLDAGNNRVQMFDQKDRFILEWGEYGSDERRGQFKRPSTIAVVPDSCQKTGDDIVIVVDAGNNRFQWFRVPCKGDLSKLPNLPVGHAGSVFKIYVPRNSGIYGQYGDLGEYGIATGKFNRPLDIAFEEPMSKGVMFWILDAGNERLQRFWLEYKLSENKITIEFVDEFRNLTGERGSLKDQVSVAWSRERSFTYLYLLGRGCALQKFKLGKLPVLETTWPAVAPESGLCVPARVRYDERKEYVYVLDSGNSMISIFHRAGNFISAIRGSDRVFDEPGGFVFLAASGEFFVADTGNDLVQKFTLR